MNHIPSSQTDIEPENRPLEDGKIMFLYKTSVFRFYVSLSGCIQNLKSR